MNEPVTVEEFAEWLTHPVTKALRFHCHKQREALKEGFAKADFTRENLDGSDQSHARVIGECLVYEEIRDLDFSQLNQGSNDD